MSSSKKSSHIVQQNIVHVSKDLNQVIQHKLKLQKQKSGGIQKIETRQETQNIKAQAEETQKELDAVLEVAETLSGTTEVERERLWRIFNILPCYIALIDQHKRIRFSNKSFQDYFGVDNGFCYKVMANSDTPCQTCQPFDAYNARSSSVHEWATANGQHAFRTYSYPFDDTTGETFLLSVGFNISTSLRMRQALDFSESSYRTVTDNLSIGIAVLGLDLTIIAGNARLQNWFGKKFQRGVRLCDLLQCTPEHGNLLPGQFCTDCPFYATLKDNGTHEKELALSGGGKKHRTIRLVSCPITNKNGSIKALTMMFEDITKRLMLNRRLQKVRNLETIGALAGGIAHEINQPLSALNLYTSGLQMMLEKSEEPDMTKINERLGLILKESEKIRSIISNMRALVMKDKHTVLEAVHVAEIVTSTLEIMEHQLIARNIAVTISIPSTLPLVKSQSVQLEQVLINLLTNAIHAIDAAKDTSAKTIDISAGINNTGKVAIAIADSGDGLPPGKERIFDPFFSTKSTKSMGLGLSIVNGLVNQWGGEISARPKGGKLGGATFFVTLEVADASLQATNAPPPSPTSF